MILPGPFSVSSAVGVAVGSGVSVGRGVSVSVGVDEGVNVAVDVGVIVGMGVAVTKNAITPGVEQPVKRKKTIMAGKIRFIDCLSI